MLNEEIDEAVEHQTKIHGTHRETKTALHWNAKNPIARENDCCACLFSSPPCTKTYIIYVYTMWRRLWTRTLANISETKNNLLLVLLFGIYMYVQCYYVCSAAHCWNMHELQVTQRVWNLLNSFRWYFLYNYCHACATMWSFNGNEMWPFHF